MVIRIAHLSDIHFGVKFHGPTWDAVRDAIADLDPDIIVVSGDLVDDPIGEHLLAAKCELRRLSMAGQEAWAGRPGSNGRKAELVVAPGNHDVFWFGLSEFQVRNGWFERIFHRSDKETKDAELSLSGWLGCKWSELGFTDKLRGYTPPKFKPLRTVRGIWQRAKAFFGVGSLVDHLHSLSKMPPSADRIIAPPAYPLLFALLDSNDTECQIAHAQGSVDVGELLGLKAALKRTEGHFLARIAVVHHHVLPVAHTSDSLESKMVFRNAGAVLDTFARHRFDLILHGHWHKQQVARFDMGRDDDDSYPMIVAAAGSAARNDGREDCNCFNLITVEENGRIQVKNVLYGGTREPRPDGDEGKDVRTYRESISSVKRRAFARARDRHRIECELREQAYRISENGDLWVEHRVRDLRLRRGPEPYNRRPIAPVIPEHGRFAEETLELLEKSRPDIELVIEPISIDASQKEYWVDIKSGLNRDGATVSYAVSYGCANSINMTQWEALERARHKPKRWEEEFIGLFMRYPARRAVLSVSFPESMADIEPYVNCMRHPDYPRYEVDALGDARMDVRREPAPLGTALISISSDDEYLPDGDLQKEEEKGLRYAVPRVWRLEVERPMVGYLYELRWAVPGQIPRGADERRVEGETDVSRLLLLRLGNRLSAKQPTSTDSQILEVFIALRTFLTNQLSCTKGSENLVVALFVYDSKTRSLRPVLSHRSWWPNEPLPMTFEVPLGRGVAGAGFLQRRVVVWTERAARESLIQLVPYPRSESEPIVELKHVLALPIYHDEHQDDPRPPPWAVVGVVAVGSDSPTSRMMDLDAGTDSEKEQLVRLRGNAQVRVVEIVDTLSRTADLGASEQRPLDSCS